MTDWQQRSCAGTAFNRWTFFCDMEALLQQSGAAGPLSLLDLQSIIHELCHNFPLSVVKNAFTPACALAQEGAHCFLHHSSAACRWRCPF